MNARSEGVDDCRAQDRNPCLRLSAKHVLEYLDYLIRGLRPRHCLSIDLFEWMNNVFIVQGDVGLANGRAITGIKCSVPLLVSIAKTDHRDIAFLH